MVSAIRFANVAHIVVPKQALGHALRYERLRSNNTPNHIWQQDFPFDSSFKEAVFLSGGDLNAAKVEAKKSPGTLGSEGRYQDWDFSRAYDFAKTRKDPKVELTETSVSDPHHAFLDGSRELVGQSLTRGRYVEYRHTT